MARNGLLWLDMDGVGQKGLEMARNGWKCLKVTKVGWKRMDMTGKGQKCLDMLITMIMMMAMTMVLMMKNQRGGHYAYRGEFSKLKISLFIYN